MQYHRCTAGIEPEVFTFDRQFVDEIDTCFKIESDIVFFDFQGIDIERPATGQI